MYDAEREAYRQARTKSADAVAAKKKKVSRTPFPVIMNDLQRARLDALTGFCMANRVPASKATVVRALIDAANPSEEFGEYLAGVYEKELNHWYEQRGIKPRED